MAVENGPDFIFNVSFLQIILTIELVNTCHVE
jgi:hypothetical protein